MFIQPLRIGVRCVLFVGIFAMLIGLLETRFDALYPDYNAYQFQELLHSTKPADIITLGSSTTVHGYVPDILQTLDSGTCNVKSVFNFGYMGGQPPFYLQWYRLLFVPHYPPPKIVIVSLDWFSAGAKRRDAEREQVALAQDSRYLPWDVLVKLFWKAEAKTKAALIMNMLRIVHIGPDVRYLFVHREDPAMEGYDRGYMPLDDTLNPEEQNREFSVNEEFLHDLSSLLTEIQAHGSKAVLVQIPAYKPESIHNLQGSRVFGDIAREHGVPYIDYNVARRSAFNAQAQFFADWSHLNRKGSEAFSTKFRNDLSALIHDSHLCH